MTNSNSSTSFTKQNDSEKQSRLLNIMKSDGDIVVWEKGSKSKDTFSCFNFDKSTFLVTLKTTSKTKLNGKNVLYSFVLNGVSYFGQGQFKQLETGQCTLDCSGDLFKSERRESYRLLTYPHHNVYVQIPVTAEQLKKSNIVDINTGMSQTGLFNNFLDIVGGNQKEQMKEGFMRFRVLDISVTGLAFQITDLEKNYIAEKKEMAPIFLNFNGDEIKISNSEIRYVIPLLKRTGKAYKVGVKFKDLDINEDEFLGRKINEALRDFESEFEDFI